MYNHVLVAVAFHEDDTEARALEAARLLAGDTGKVTALHVREAIPASTANLLPEGYLAKMRAEITENLKRLTAGMTGGGGVVVDGHAGRTIVEWAENNGVDCIVIASHRPGLQDYFLGSTAARVVRHAQCSVHVLR